MGMPRQLSLSSPDNHSSADELQCVATRQAAKGVRHGMYMAGMSFYHKSAQVTPAM